MFKISHAFMNLKIREKFIFAYIIFTLLPSIATGIIFYAFYSDMVKRQTVQIVEQSMSQVVSQINHMQSEIENLGAIFTKDTIFQDILVKEDISNYKQVQEFQTLKKMIYQIAQNPSIYRIRLFVPDEKIYSDDRNIIFPLSEVYNTPFLADKISGWNTSGWSGSYIAQNKNKEKEEIISYAVLFKDILYSSFRDVGCLIVDMKENYYNNIIDDVKTGEKGFSFILIEKSKQIFSKDNFDNAQAVILYRIVKEESNGYSTIQPEYKSMKSVRWGSSDYYVMKKKVNNSDWYLVSFIDRNEIYKGIGSIIEFTILVVLCFSVFSIVTSIIVSGRLTRGIYQLINKMKTADTLFEGDISEVNVLQYKESADEVGKLHNSFDKMIRRLKELTIKNTETEIEKREARFKLLQSQINPHFLYNALDSINWMAIKEKAYAMSNMISMLGRYYRIGLSEGRDIITIGEEIEHVKLYLELQKVRFENNISVEMDIEEEIKAFLIVKFTLQPIVENAIVHGIGNIYPEQGVIRIKAYKDENIGIIQIINNGKSLENALYKTMTDGNSIFPSSKGYGMRNVIERMKLFFGDSFCFELKRMDDLYTVAEFRFVLKKPSDRVEI